MDFLGDLNNPSHLHPAVLVEFKLLLVAIRIGHEALTILLCHFILSLQCEKLLDVFWNLIWVVRRDIGWKLSSLAFGLLLLLGLARCIVIYGTFAHHVRLHRVSKRFKVAL